MKKEINNARKINYMEQIIKLYEMKDSLLKEKSRIQLSLKQVEKDLDTLKSELKLEIGLMSTKK